MMVLHRPAGSAAASLAQAMMRASGPSLVTFVLADNAPLTSSLACCAAPKQNPWLDVVLDPSQAHTLILDPNAVVLHHLVGPQAEEPARVAGLLRAAVRDFTPR